MSEQQEFDRRSGIGASLAPEVLGLSPWGTPLSAYLYLAGLLPDKQATEPMRIGTAVESAIRELAEERLGCVIWKPSTQRHPDHEWMYASPDGIVGGSSGFEGFEAKNVGPARAKDWGEQGSDEIPDYVNLQCQHQAAVFGFKTLTVAVLICGNSFRLYNVHRNDRVIAGMIEIEAEFWNRVGKGQPPEPDWNHPTTPKLVEAMYGVDESLQVTLPDKYASLAAAYENFKQAEKQAKDAKELVQAEILQGMAGAALAWLPDGSSILRKKVIRKAYEVKASEYFSFKINRKEIAHDCSSRELDPAALDNAGQGQPLIGHGAPLSD